MENKEFLNSVLEMAMQKENYDTVARMIYTINDPATRREILFHLTYKKVQRLL